MAAKKAAKKTAAKKAPVEKLKFGIDYLAKKLNLEPATARVKLRNLEVKKTGKSYGWNTQAEADKVAAQLSATE